MNETAFGQNTNSLLDILVIGAGLFLIYSALLMKFKGEIPKSLVSKNIDPDQAPDKESYIKHMFIPCILMGLLMMVGGGVFTAMTYLHIAMPETAPMVFYLGSMAIVIAFGVYSMNMQKRYLKND